MQAMAHLRHLGLWRPAIYMLLTTLGALPWAHAAGGHDGVPFTPGNVVRGVFQEVWGSGNPRSPMPAGLQWTVLSPQEHQQRLRPGDPLRGIQVMLNMRLERNETETLARAIAKKHGVSLGPLDEMEFYLHTWPNQLWASARMQGRGMGFGRTQWDIRQYGHTRSELERLVQRGHAMPGQLVGNWSGWQRDGFSYQIARQGAQWIVQEHTGMGDAIQNTSTATQHGDQIRLVPPLGVNSEHLVLLPHGELQERDANGTTRSVIPVQHLLTGKPASPP